ncbi:MAG: hypothetical protein J6D21_01750 [Clostridia bacterium]|nr:hypothetical protein [Clostridia bacterium]
MKNETFSYQYSAKRNQEVESIRKKYIPQEESKIEILRKLDSRVQTAGMIESLCIGIIGALVFGIGMCFFLDVFVGVAWIDKILFVAGMMLMIPAYPMHRHISRKTKAKLTPEILRLTDELMKS